MVGQLAVDLRLLLRGPAKDPPPQPAAARRLEIWSRRPVLEMNTSCRMQWGKDGNPSRDDNHGTCPQPIVLELLE